MATIEERVARLEGAYEHMASKADLVGLRGNVQMLSQHVSSMNDIIREMIQRLDDLEDGSSRRPIGFGN